MNGLESPWRVWEQTADKLCLTSFPTQPRPHRGVSQGTQGRNLAFTSLLGSARAVKEWLWTCVLGAVWEHAFDSAVCEEFRFRMGRDA